MAGKREASPNSGSNKIKGVNCVPIDRGLLQKTAGVVPIFFLVYKLIRGYYPFACFDF